MNQNTSLNVKYRGTPQRFVLGGSAPSSTYSPCPFINHFKETVLTSNPYNYLTTLHPFKVLDEVNAVSYTHLRAHETDSYLVCRLLLEKKNGELAMFL